MQYENRVETFEKAIAQAQIIMFPGMVFQQVMSQMVPAKFFLLQL